MNEKKKTIISLSIIILLVIIVIGISYALLQKVLTGSKETVIKAGNLSLVVKENGNEISLSEAYPMADSEGLASTGFAFTVENKGNVGANYETSLEDVELDANQVRLSNENIKFSLTKNKKVGVSTVLSEVNCLLDSDFLAGGKTNSYELKLWLREDFIGEIEGQVFKTRLKIKAVQGEDKRLASKLIKEYTNPSNITTYAAGDKTKMYTFFSTAGAQQIGYTSEELIEYRYIGNVPNNYIRFNDELWRIIGVFTVENEAGKKEQRVKLVRNENIGSYSWDSTKEENGNGKNRWNDAEIMKLLNGGYESETVGGSLYWNKQSGNCNNGSNSTTVCDFTTTGLNETAKNLIGKTKWYLGAYQSNYIDSIDMAKAEKGTTVFESSSYPRELNWTGMVGLLYVSDYGYTYSLGVDKQCFTQLNACVSSIADPGSGWLYNRSSQWTITPHATTSYSVFHIDLTGYSTASYASYFDGIRPSVYLKSDVKISLGSGTISDPFQIIK